MAERLNTPLEEKGAKAPPPEGDNSGKMTDAEREALFNHHLAKLRGATAEVDKARAVLSEKQGVLSDFYRAAKVDDRRWTRKLLQEVVEKTGGKTSRRDVLAEEAARQQAFLWAGLPIGAQPDLFDGVPAAAKDELEWGAEGYLAGRRADERKPPADCPAGGCTQEWLKQYDEGQAYNARQLAMLKPAQGNA